MPRQPLCRVCKSPFSKRSMGHVACSAACALEVAKLAREKKERAMLRAGRAKQKTLADHKADAQDTINKWVRTVRDVDKPCISCGVTNARMNAGHYLSRGAHVSLALCPDNIYKQCVRCNKDLHGNQIKYRQALVLAGLSDLVEWLEGPHATQKLTIDDCKSAKALFAKLTKERRAFITPADWSEHGLAGKIPIFMLDKKSD